MAVSAPSSSMLESFVLDEDVAQLEVVDDLWYFVTNGHGSWIVGG